MRKVQFTGLLILLVALPLRAQFWQKKEYRQWSKSECAQILRDSPWVRSRTLGQVTIQMHQEEPAAAGRDANPQITYRAMLWSARPVREAVVRQAQLSSEYEKMPLEQKQALDERHAKLLSVDFSQHVVIRLSYSASAQAYDYDLARHWQTQAPAALKQSIYLIGSPGKVNPMQVNVAQGQAREITLVFPRHLDGQPLAGPNDKTLALEFEHPLVGVLAGERVYLDFSVKKLVINGQVAY